MKNSNNEEPDDKNADDGKDADAPKKPKRGAFPIRKEDIEKAQPFIPPVKREDTDPKKSKEKKEKSNDASDT
jgi:hypothetical protein